MNISLSLYTYIYTHSITGFYRHKTLLIRVLASSVSGQALSYSWSHMLPWDSTILDACCTLKPPLVALFVHPRITAKNNCVKIMVTACLFQYTNTHSPVATGRYRTGRGPCFPWNRDGTGRYITRRCSLTSWLPIPFQYVSFFRVRSHHFCRGQEKYPSRLDEFSGPSCPVPTSVQGPTSHFVPSRHILKFPIQPRPLSGNGPSRLVKNPDRYHP